MISDAPHSAAGGGAVKQRTAAMLLLSAAVLFNFSEPAVDVSFPRLVRDFNIDIADIKWMVVVLIIPFIPAALLGGQLGDSFGHRRIFILGALLSVIAYTLCAYVTAFHWFIVCRIVQGAATGLSVSCIIALMTLMYPPQQKRRVLSIFVLMVGTTYAVSPLVGSLIADAAGGLDIAGWRVVYLCRALLAGVVLCACRLLPAGGGSGGGVDWTGGLFLLFFCGGILLTPALLTSGEYQPAAAFTLLAACMSLYYYVQRERRCRHPLLPVADLSNRHLLLMQLSVLVLNICCFSLMLLIPFVAVRLFDSISLLNGIMLALMPIGMMGAAALAGRLPYSSLQIVRGGLLLTAGGLLLCGFFTAQALPLAVVLILTGGGVGLFQTGYVDITTSLLPPARRGVAGSLSSLMQRFGFALGAGAITTLPGFFRRQQVMADEYGLTFAVFGALLLLFSLLFIALYKPPASAQ